MLAIVPERTFQTSRQGPWTQQAGGLKTQPRFRSSLVARAPKFTDGIMGSNRRV